MFEETPLWQVDAYDKVFSSLATDDDDKITSSASLDSMSSDDVSDTTINTLSDKDVGRVWDDLSRAGSIHAVDMDEIMAAEATSSRGVSSDHLSKVWRISL